MATTIEVYWAAVGSARFLRKVIESAIKLGPAYFTETQVTPCKFPKNPKQTLCYSFTYELSWCL